jgi:hypothetical protein
VQESQLKALHWQRPNAPGITDITGTLHQGKYGCAQKANALCTLHVFGPKKMHNSALYF